MMNEKIKKLDENYAKVEKEYNRIIEDMYFDLDRQHIELNGDEVFIDIIPLENNFKNIETVDIVKKYLKDVCFEDYFERYNEYPKKYIAMLCINSMWGACYLYDDTNTIDDVLKDISLNIY